MASEVSASQVPIREPADYRGTIRMTGWHGGYDRPVLQEFSGQATVDPEFYDAQNIDWYSNHGQFSLCAKSTQIDTQATDREYLLYDFNVAIYRIPLANFVATEVQKTTGATGVPVWAALTNVYPGAVAPRGATVWRDQFIVASGETTVRVMSTVEVWTTLTAPAGVTAPVCGQVGVSQDDRLLVWWEGTAQAGLWAWDATAWVKIYPTAGTTPTSSSLTCDAIIRGAGSVLVFTRDVSSKQHLIEINTVSTGTQFNNWLDQPGARFWPQCGDVFDGEVYFVGRLGGHLNVGALFSKAIGQPPEIIATLDTNLATSGQIGQDWAWRCFKSVGDVAWISGSSREDRAAAIYLLTTDNDGNEVLGPVAVVNGVTGPVYSIAMLPVGAAGVSGTDRLFFSLTRATYFKDADFGTDPTADAASGFIQFPDIDLGVADHVKIGRFIEAYLKQKSTGGTIEFQYRIDPQTPNYLGAGATSPWQSFGFAATQGLMHKASPDDNPALKNYGQKFRTLQLRCVLQRATSGTIRDIVDTVAYDVAQVLPLSSSTT